MTTTDITQAGGSLAIRADQTGWTDDQAAVLRQTGIDNDVTNAELASFLHLCQRTQLDPFSRQIYLIGRWDNRQKRKVFTPQTGIDGYRVIAHRVIAETRHTFGYEDTLWCDSNGQWRDVWLSASAPSAAKVTVLRNGQRFSAVALYREYVQTDRNDNPTRMWANMGANQIAKCAEALALRKAFPHDLAGVYTTEEMEQADNPSADERHLRKVEPGQGDPWETPAPGRDFLTEAETAPDVEAVRQIWREAKQAGMPEPVLAGIVEISKLKDAPKAEPTAVPETGSDDVVEAEVLSPEDDYADAVAQLRAAAEAARLDMNNFEVDAAKALGTALADAPVPNIRALADTIRAAA